MVSHCCVANCPGKYKKGKNVKFHRFPKNEALRRKWIEFVGKNDFNPRPWTVLCGDHFLQDNYERNVHGNLVLKKDSIPSIVISAVSKISTPRASKKASRDSKSSAPRVLRAILPKGPLPPTHLEEAMVSIKSQEIPTDSPVTSVHSEEALIIKTEPKSIVESYKPSISKKEISQRKPSIPTHLEDFREEDLESPTKRREYWNISQAAVSKYRKDSKFIRFKVKCKEKKILYLQMVLEDLQSKLRLSSNATL